MHVQKLVFRYFQYLMNHRNDQNKVSIVVQADSLQLQLHVYLRTTVLHGSILLSLKCFVTHAVEKS